MVRIIWAISFNRRILKPWWPHIPPVHMVNQSTLDVGCFSHKLFESRILQTFGDGVRAILYEAKIIVSRQETDERMTTTIVNESCESCKPNYHVSETCKHCINSPIEPTPPILMVNIIWESKGKPGTKIFSCCRWSWTRCSCRSDFRLLL